MKWIAIVMLAALCGCGKTESRVLSESWKFDGTEEIYSLGNYRPCGKILKVVESPYGSRFDAYLVLDGDDIITDSEILGRDLAQDFAESNRECNRERLAGR